MKKVYLSYKHIDIILNIFHNNNIKNMLKTNFKLSRTIYYSSLLLGHMTQSNKTLKQKIKDVHEDLIIEDLLFSTLESISHICLGNTPISIINCYSNSLKIEMINTFNTAKFNKTSKINKVEHDLELIVKYIMDINTVCNIFIRNGHEINSDVFNDNISEENAIDVLFKAMINLLVLCGTNNHEILHNRLYCYCSMVDIDLDKTMQNLKEKNKI